MKFNKSQFHVWVIKLMEIFLYLSKAETESADLLNVLMRFDISHSKQLRNTYYENVDHYEIYYIWIFKL